MHDNKPRDASFMTLNLDFEFEDQKDKERLDSASPRTLSLTSGEGFEMQDTIGGHSDHKTTPIVRNEKVVSAIKGTAVESSDEDEDPLVAMEGKPFVNN